jgi:hypothetical protein
MAEVAPGGGVLAIDMLDEAAIARGIARLAGEAGLIERLRREAVARPIRTWEDYGRDMRPPLCKLAIAETTYSPECRKGCGLVLEPEWGTAGADSAGEFRAASACQVFGEAVERVGSDQHRFRVQARFSHVGCVFHYENASVSLRSLLCLGWSRVYSESRTRHKPPRRWF